MKYGLLGRVLGHSFSKAIHAQLGDYSYEMFQREEDEIPELLEDEQISGLNVTIPYKEKIMEFCDVVTERGKKIGCINTVVFNQERRLLGDNTDYYGFMYLLNSLVPDVNQMSALILGDGATSKTVSAVLEDKGIEYVKLSRKTPPFYSDMKKYQNADILINTTPVGMYPNNGKGLVDLKEWPYLKAVIDVVYNPLKTKLLLDAKNLGIPHSGGLPMLVVQAVKASEIFTGKEVASDKTEEIIKKLVLDFGNIVLIGMPGSGKTTVGKELARVSGRTFVDLDDEIEKYTGMAIPDIFEKYGEDHFRHLESEVIQEFGKQTGIIIATGGGAVTRADNYNPLVQNGRIYLLERDLESLELKGRPLSTSRDQIKALWEERKDAYTKFSDAKVYNQDIEKAALEIWEDYNENFAY